MSVFHIFHHLSLPKPDPLGGGLAEEIAEEQAEPEAITLDDFVNVTELQARWGDITRDFEQDPEWSELAYNEHE